MDAPSKPRSESLRLAALTATGLLDSAPEERFDRYTRLVQQLFDVPIALVSLVDDRRQWFKSRQGLDAPETPRDVSFCGHTILGNDIMQVDNTLDDQRFCDNPLVTEDPNIRFYAGCPLRSQDGHRIGTLCIIDRRPRKFSEAERQSLRDVAQMVCAEINAIEESTIDELTGLSNRRAFNLLAGEVMQARGHQPCPLSLVMLDVSGLGRINDSSGPAAGDAALRTFACLLADSFSVSDVIARVGGDEFCVLLSGDNCDRVSDLISDLEMALERHCAATALASPIGFRTGVARLPGNESASTDELLQAADRALHESAACSRLRPSVGVFGSMAASRN